MNNKAQMSPFTIVVVVLIFFLVLGAGLGKIVNDLVGISNDYSTQAGASGIELFLLNNLLLWIVLVFIIAVLWWSR